MLLEEQASVEAESSAYLALVASESPAQESSVFLTVLRSAVAATVFQRRQALAVAYPRHLEA